MPGFFLQGSQSKKRKTESTRTANIKYKKVEKEIESDDDDDSIVSGDELETDQSDSDNETAQEKRLRLAKEYINKIEQEELDKQLDKEIDRDAIAHRLQQDALEDVGRLQKFIADQVKPSFNEIRHLRGHKLSITCLVVSSDNKFIFSASKDGTIMKWAFDTGKKIGKINNQSKSKSGNVTRHTGQVLCLALSTDSRYLASGGQDQLVYVWNPETMEHLHTFKGHRDVVSGLAFQQKKHQLFSASSDKTIKVWNLDEMAYVETLFGHEDAVLGIDSLMRDRVVSCGGRDRSVRLWKIPEESQLVFQSTVGSSFDCVTMLNEEYFLTGGDDGSLSVFNIRKKKPITLRTNAHVKINSTSANESWITAVSSIPYTDLVASGSCDGCIKLWRCEKSFRSIMPIHSIPMPGFINSLKFSSDGKYLVAGIGQEHRLGRWWKLKDCKNSICIIPLISVTENS